MNTHTYDELSLEKERIKLLILKVSNEDELKQAHIRIKEFETEYKCSITADYLRNYITTMVRLKT